MINSFLVTLHNNATQPVNVSSPRGNILWPSSLLVRTYTGPALFANQLLFDNLPTSDFDHFLTAIQLLWVVQESVCVDRIFADDPRTSYTQNQLVAQFTDNTTHNRQCVSAILSERLGSIPALEFLEGDLLEIYRGALSDMDKLAAIISYFGERP